MSLSADANDSAGQVPVLEDSPVQTEQDRSNDNGSDHQAPNEHAGVINSSRGQTPVPSGEGTENGRGVQTSSEDQKQMSDLTRLTKEIWDHENARVKRWRNEINSLLTFAGLFAAVVTGFGVQYYTMMQQPAAPDYNTQILERISLQLAGLVNQTNSNPSQPLPSSLPPFDIPEIVPAHAYVAALWFAALVCGLAAASIAILVNQWVNNLLTPVALSGTGSHEQLRVWNLRHQTFRSWGLAVFIDIPSVLLQVALILFLVGLVGYLWQLSVKVAMPALVLVAVLLLFLSVTTIIPVFLAYSPFISPQSLFLRWICVPIKLTFYGSMARFFSCLWVKSQLTYINGYLGSLMDQLQKRLDDLQALRVYGYYGWATEETAYLRSEAGQAIDKTMIANAFSLVKDYNILLPLIHSSLKEMQPDVAFSNVITICKRRPPVLDGDDVPRWQHDIRDDNIFVDMGKLVADLIAMRTWSTNQDADKKSLDEALDAFDNSLGAVRDDTNGIQVYMCLFDFLRNKDLQDTAIVTRVLTLIYNYDNFFSISADTGEYISLSLTRAFKLDTIYRHRTSQRRELVDLHRST
ncbi:uncharacterized protein B0H18DRAFT_233939 [Fomitopsis serialis]|uniref:uncharacterized protein n=1 Tax=Fomitopsis serialis TaxID=139415 RepID=UPI0020079888|nr:uncharacterized protein B0H18DRAFT_233939 [Neoantrodia serialis]KAH9928899.1 hypothetical protein B0H18DRAFT_233939 [Neoantrodia serialis]